MQTQNAPVINASIDNTIVRVVLCSPLPADPDLVRRLSYLLNGIPMGIVHSSGGDIEIDMRTGEVLHISDDADPEYAKMWLNIHHFDLREYFLYWKYSPLDVNEFDILDLAFTAKDGSTEPAEPSFRLDCKYSKLEAMSIKITKPHINSPLWQVDGRSFDTWADAVNWAYAHYVEK